MSGIVDEFMQLRRAIARSQFDHRQVYACISMTRTLGAAIGWRHHTSWRQLREAVSLLVTRPTATMAALDCLDALEIEIIQPTIRTAGTIVLRRVGHLALIRGGKAA